jgi:type VI protein secretion system component Hcp
MPKSQLLPKTKVEDEMNRSSKTQFTAIRLAILAGILMVSGAHRAYAQSSTPDKAIAKMTIIGIAGDNADGTIEVVGIEQRTFVTSGKPNYSLVVTKKIDRATPRLFAASLEGVPLNQVKIVWTKINPTTNQEEFSHSTTLSNVMLTLVRQRPADSSNAEVRQLDEYEDLTFSVNSLAGAGIGKVLWEYALPGGRTLTRIGYDFAMNKEF